MLGKPCLYTLRTLVPRVEAISILGKSTSVARSLNLQYQYKRLSILLDCANAFT